MSKLVSLLKEKSLKLTTPDKPFVLSSGEKSLFFIDVKQTSHSADGQFLIAELMSEMMAECDAVAGVALGGCSLASSLSLFRFMKNNHKLSTLYVRKELKDHGTKQLIEGPVSPEMRVVLTEDVITTGDSTIKAIKALQEVNVNVVQVLSVIDREVGGVNKIRDMGIECYALVRLHELLQ